MEKISSLIEMSKKYIEYISEAFYKQVYTEGYNKTVGLINILSELITSMENVGGYEEYIVKITEVLKETLIAMEEKDEVMISDILRYELMDLIENIEVR